MISPSREDLAPFNGFEAANFAAWLKAGLEGYLIEDEGVWGFKHVAVFLQGEEHLALALGHVYRELPTLERAEFRKALAEMVATLEADPVNAPVLEHLLAIAAVLPAPEVLDVLQVKIGNGFFGSIDAEEGRSLFEKTMDTVIDLAAPTAASRTCIEMLLGSRNFNVAYSGLALLTLCRIAPHDFVAHMKLLRAPLAKMFEQFRTDKETKKRLAEGIALSVTPIRLADDLCKLDLSERGDAADMWLFPHIGVGFNERNIPVVRSLSEPSVQIEIKETRTRMPVERSWPGRDSIIKISQSTSDMIIKKGGELLGPSFEDAANRDVEDKSVEVAA